MGDKVCFIKVCYVDSSQSCLYCDKSLELSPVINNHPSLPGTEGMTEGCGVEGGKFAHVCASFQLPLAQNHPYVRVPYFRVA